MQVSVVALGSKSELNLCASPNCVSGVGVRVESPGCESQVEFLKCAFSIWLAIPRLNQV